MTNVTFRATWNNVVLAESDQTIEVEGNQYFPPHSLSREYFQSTASTSTCPWKGKASYYSIVVDGKINADAAWYYPHPSVAAQQIKDYVAFWRGVQVVKVSPQGGES